MRSPHPKKHDNLSSLGASNSRINRFSHKKKEANKKASFFPLPVLFFSSEILLSIAWEIGACRKKGGAREMREERRPLFPPPLLFPFSLAHLIATCQRAEEEEEEER